MARMFCTLQEAARHLHISEEQMETMLQQGLLREFREGPCRLLKAAEVIALARASVGNLPPSAKTIKHHPRTTSDAEMKLPPCAAASVKTLCSHAPRPKIASQTLQEEAPAGRRPSRSGYGTGNADRRPERPSVTLRRPASFARPPAVPREALSLRQWFWNGLTQDRPAAIVVLFCLTVLLLAALVAGVCFAVRVL